jgi:hypothetical protein
LVGQRKKKKKKRWQRLSSYSEVDSGRLLRLAEEVGAGLGIGGN